MTSIGKIAEQFVAQWLRYQGYQILHERWRSPWGEIDIIAWDESTLVFIEVKARESIYYGMPSESITFHKIKKISNAALLYLKRFRNIPPVRFDVIYIFHKKNEKPQIDLFKDAFEVCSSDR